jgi:hypothetical protein
MIKGATLEKKYGLVNSSMQLFSKTDNSLLAEYNESSGWVTAFDPFASGEKNDMYTTNTFTFKDAKTAGRFANAVQSGIMRANGYPYNGGEKVNVRIDESNQNKVIITFGLEE